MLFTVRTRCGQVSTPPGTFYLFIFKLYEQALSLYKHSVAQCPHPSARFYCTNKPRLCTNTVWPSAHTSSARFLLYEQALSVRTRCGQVATPPGTFFFKTVRTSPVSVRTRYGPVPTPSGTLAAVSQQKYYTSKCCVESLVPPTREATRLGAGSERSQPINTHPLLQLPPPMSHRGGLTDQHWRARCL